MKYFAKLDATNNVLSVHLVHDDIATTEQAGIDFLNTLFKTNDVWKQTFKDSSQRKNAAARGFTYDESKDAFIAPQPFSSWTLNEDTCRWEAPVVYPDDRKSYNWIEATLSWKETEI